MKKVMALAVMAVFCLSTICSSVFAADAKKAAAPAAAQVQAAEKANLPAASAAKKPARSNFGIVMGTITKINNADPANATIEVKSTVDDKPHTLSVTPWTNVTKATDLSELKVGDSVRVMSRKAEDKETAMAIVFGKIQTRPPVRPNAQAAGAPQAPVQK